MSNMVDLGGYVIIIVETKDKKIKLYGKHEWSSHTHSQPIILQLGSPADRDNLEVGDEILEVNGKSLEDATHTEVINHIHQAIRSRTICLRVKRRSGARLALDLELCASNVQDAFVIAVEQQARERLNRLSALKKVTPVDMNKLSQQLNQQQSTSSTVPEINGIIDNSPIYVTSLTSSGAFNNNNTTSSNATAVISSTFGVGEDAKKLQQQQQQQQQKPNNNLNDTSVAAQDLILTQKIVGNDTNVQLVNDATTVNSAPTTTTNSVSISGASGDVTRQSSGDLGLKGLAGVPSVGGGDRRASSPFQNGRTEVLIGAEENKFKTTAVVENNNNKLGVEIENRPRRRSGSSIVVLDGDIEPVKRPPEEILDDPLASYNMVMMLAGGEAGPHREMAVDVPDTFVARNKTPPRYPPPKPKAVAVASPVAPLAGQQLQQQQQQVRYDPRLVLGVHFSVNDRERAVDVPDSYANLLQKEEIQMQVFNDAGKTTALNGNAISPVSAVATSPGGGGAKPVPPPRDHLRIEKDGRLVNRAPAPQVPARIVNNNNVTSVTTPVKTGEPTKEQLDSIRKFQEQLRKRKEEEDRLAQQAEFLNRSLRGSQKLRALESRSQGIVNDGYSSEEQEATVRAATPLSATPDTSEIAGELVHQAYSYGELVASLQRLQLQLKKASTGSVSLNRGGLEGRVAAVQSLLLSPQFGRAISVHNKVQEVRAKPSLRVTSNAQTVVRDCLDCLSNCASAASVELADLLSGYDMEALMVAHDGVAAVIDPESPFGSTAADPATLSNLVTSVVPPVQDHYADNNIKIIKIEKTNEPLGATVRNEGDAVVIGRVVRGGAAEKSGLLHEGDEVLEVNGVEMRGKNVNAVCDILAGMEGTLTFLIVPASQNKATTQRDTLLHVKAHFDYDPEDDLYIPCRELGISFQKGDVLHIISQEDPNWWQAYREGEEDQTLAGLVPSQSFQYQRESMKQQIGSDKNFREKPRKAGTLLCARKAPKRKKKKGAYNEGGYPIYTSTLDDYEMDEILTYEEVALYYPRANHKRPIVLIGPPNIGRHELRQKLMEDSERFAAAIPHTSRARKDSEVDGQDYHFITRAQFEADILSRKFVEHGEYEKAYYGTSLDAIRSVVNSGKICVLNLHPQSLKILRTSDLKPYVVFVAPPSLEKLRQKKITCGEAYKEEELKDIIEKAREMEDKYGHFFDMIIINNDTERAYHQLLTEINSLEREPQWVPAAWVKAL